MKWVEPEVYLVAETAHVADRSYREAIGVPGWNTDAVSDAERLIEVGGRMCYRSFDASLNRNLTKVREGNAGYIANIVRSGHGSVLEHSSVTFIFRHVSRVFTHELVRHRVGVAISQESLRYVALDDIPVVDMTVKERMSDELWTRIDANQTFHAAAERLVEHMEEFLTDWRGALIFGGDKMPLKKEVTSFLRRFAPIGLATSIMWTANLRALRHVLELRTAPGAEAEIRHVFDRVGEMLARRYPAVFADFTRSKEGVWTPKYSKV